MKTRRYLSEEGHMYPNLDCGENVVVTRVCCWPSAWSGVLLEKLLPRIWWNPNVHYHAYKIPTILLILSQVNPFHVLPVFL